MTSSPKKKLAFVTSLYDLVRRGSTEHRTVEWVLSNSDYVLGLRDQQLVIFTDPELEGELIARRRALSGHATTTIIACPFEDLITQERASAATRGTRQSNANPLKATPAYIQLMWAKYAMLERALQLTDASHLGWIDLAITHVAKLPPEGVDVFADPSDAPRVHALRCFSRRDVDHPDYLRHVYGHLAGGLVVGGRDRVSQLAGDFWRAVDRAAVAGLAPLDEGLLSYVVGQHPEDYSYSYGDYEDILRNHDESRGGETHRRWIAEDARQRGLSAVMGAPDPSASERSIMEAPKELTPSTDAATPAVVRIMEAPPRLDQHQPLIGLVMIVKNEAKRIVEVLASYRPYIDTWTILDTGSTDGTQDDDPQGGSTVFRGLSTRSPSSTSRRVGTVRSSFTARRRCSRSCPMVTSSRAAASYALSSKRSDTTAAARIACASRLVTTTTRS